MSVINFKGFQASVTYDDELLFIKVLHVNDVLVASCENSSKVEEVFRDLIEGYLEDCEKYGKEPERPFSGSFNVRIEKDMHRRVAMAAAQAELSLNSWVGLAIAEKLVCAHVEARVGNIIANRRNELAVVRMSPFGTGTRQRGRAAHNARPPVVAKLDELSRVTPKGQGDWERASVGKKLNG
jgi:predicted HicB family RNase H-like nuclease